MSTFEHLTEDDITEGFAALASDAAAEKEPRPIEEHCDLLVLGGLADHIRTMPATPPR